VGTSLSAPRAGRRSWEVGFWRHGRSPQGTARRLASAQPPETRLWLPAIAILGSCQTENTSGGPTEAQLSHEILPADSLAYDWKPGAMCRGISSNALEDRPANP